MFSAPRKRATKGSGSGENECRRSVLNDGAFSQYRDFITEHHGVGVIVRYKDCR